MEQPVILCGLGKVGWRVLDYLRAAGVPVVAVDHHCPPSDARLGGVRLVRGDYRQPAVLEEAGVARARGVVIVSSDDLVNISAVLMVRHLNPGVRVVVRLFNQSLVPRLGKAVANVVPLSTSGLTAPLIALTALTGHALGAFGSEEWRCQVVDLGVSEGSLLCGRLVGETASEYGVAVVAHLPISGPAQFLADVEASTRLAEGDRLVVCAETSRLAPLLSLIEGETPPGLLWAGWLRRLWRMGWRTLADVEPGVKICALALALVIVVSTLLYHLGNRDWPESLYRTVSVIATGADMHEDKNPSGPQKIFVSVLRITGAAMLAAFTAFLTNYLLRARLGGVLEIRRIPDSGHVIVCGLGNLGFRVVEELLRADEQVVVIERSRDSRFLVVARRLRAAVIVGDATLPEVLRQANAASARAVVAVTNDELANLEIALVTRELNSRQRVVVRVSDVELAQTLRDTANVRFALSIPALAAPAFAAAVFGDRIQSVFLVGDRLLAALELVVEADDPHPTAGQAVRTLAIDYRLLAVSVVGGDGKAREPAMEQTLALGDRLTLVATLRDLDRLLRQERVPSNGRRKPSQ